MAEEKKTRRAFVKGAAQVAVTAPAVAVLLSNTSAQAITQLPYGGGPETAGRNGADDTFITNR